MIPVADDTEPRTQPSLRNSPPDRKEVILKGISLRPSLSCLVPSLPSFRSLTSDSSLGRTSEPPEDFLQTPQSRLHPQLTALLGVRGGGLGQYLE